MAAEPFKTYSMCRRCMGTGIASETVDGVQENPCTECDGSGYNEKGRVDGAEQIADLTDKVDDLLDKVNDIFEKVNE